MQLKRIQGKSRTPGWQRRRWNSPPGNGRLLLALIGSLLITVGLVMLNFMWIDDKPDPPEALQVPADTGPVVQSKDAAGDSATAAKPQARKNRHRVTFYHELTNQRDKRGWASDASSGSPGPPADSSAKQAPTASPHTDGGGSPDDRTANDVTSRQLAARPASPHLPSESSAAPSTRYTVQIGAFSQPQIALQRAGLWRRKGYTVSMKPLARPREGVVYRLFVGNFASVAKADELVARLRKKEGITATTVPLKN